MQNVYPKHNGVRTTTPIEAIKNEPDWSGLKGFSDDGGASATEYWIG